MFCLRWVEFGVFHDLSTHVHFTRHLLSGGFIRVRSPQRCDGSRDSCTPRTCREVSFSPQCQAKGRMNTREKETTQSDHTQKGEEQADTYISQKNLIHIMSARRKPNKQPLLCKFGEFNINLAFHPLGGYAALLVLQKLMDKFKAKPPRTNAIEFCVKGLHGSFFTNRCGRSHRILPR